MTTQVLVWQRRELDDGRFINLPKYVEAEPVVVEEECPCWLPRQRRPLS